MNKTLLTITAMCTLGAVGTYAQSSFDTEQTITDNNGIFNYKYTESDVINMVEGEEADDVDNTETISQAFDIYELVVRIRDIKVVYDEINIANLTLTGMNSTMLPKPTITSWSKNPKDHSTTSKVNVYYTSFIEDDEANMEYIVDTESEDYQKYKEACDICCDMFGIQKIVSGTYNKITAEDADGYQINPDLYYMFQKSGKSGKYVPILSLDFSYITGKKYNGCTTTYIPTYFEDAALADYTGELESIKVSGEADNYLTTVVEADGGVFLYDDKKEQLYAAINLKDGATYTLPATLTTISDLALENMRNVTLVAQSSRVTITGSGELGGENNILICASDKLEITDVNGKLGKVTGIVNAENLAIFDPGDYLNIDFTEATIVADEELTPYVPTNKLYYFAKDANVSGTNVVVGKNCESYELYDLEDGEPVLTEVYVWKDFNTDEAAYYRTFKRGSYSTLIMPFTGNANSYLTTTALTNYDNKAQKFQFTREQMAANKPYLVYADNNTSRIKGAGLISATEATSNIQGNATFTGTYETLYAKNGDLNTTNDFLFTSGGVLNFVGPNAGLRPCRAYMTLQNPPVKTESITFEFIDEDGTTFTIDSADVETGIEGLIYDEIANDNSVISTKYFDVMGARLDAPAKGLNIIREQLANGKTKTTKKVF